MYIYQKSNWPIFIWDKEATQQALSTVIFKIGRLYGRMEGLGFQLQDQAILQIMTSDVIKTCEIEGENLNKEEVRSSIAKHLGIEIVGPLPSDRRVDGIVEMLLDATRRFDQPLTKERLLHWHKELFESGFSGLSLVNRGFWRTDSDGPMQVVSGHYGRLKVHFEAPPASELPNEISRFLKWFNNSDEELNLIIKSAIAHLWFVTLHPFDDGNGRISRAIADMMLARADNQPNRFYSMSTQIQRDRKNYYLELESAQKGSLDITSWILWFLKALSKAVDLSDSILEHVLNKARFWEQNRDKNFNQRQIAMLNILFDGIKGNLTSSKWAKMMKCSQDTATRDIHNLIDQGILQKSAESGRSTKYNLVGFAINQID